MEILAFLAVCVVLSPFILSIVAFNKVKASNIVVDKLREQLERLKTDHELLRLEFEMQQSQSQPQPKSHSYSSTEKEALKSVDVYSKPKGEVLDRIEGEIESKDEVSNTLESRDEKIVLASESVHYSDKLFGLLASIRKRLPEPITRLVEKMSPIALVGIGIVFVGLSFLIKLTYQAFSVPLWFKLSAIAVAGVCFVGLGWRLRKKPSYFGVILQGSGMAVLYLVTVAAGRYFALIPIELTFLLLFVLVVVTTLLALLQNTQIMAVVAAIAGFAVPVLLATEASGSHLVLLGYYLLLNIGLVFLAYKKKWYFLEKSGVICTFVLVEFWLIVSYQPVLMWETLPFLSSYFILYFLLAHSHASEDFSNKNHVISNALVFTLPLASYALFYTATATVEEYTAYSSLFLFVSYTVAAIVTFKVQKNDQLVSIYKAFALLFLAIAIPVFFSATFTAAIYALKAATIVWLSNKQNRNKFALVGLAFLMASFYQLYQLHEVIFHYPTEIWSWVTQLIVIWFVLAYYVSDWTFSYKTHQFSVLKETVSQFVMAAIVFLTVIPWFWVTFADANSLLIIQLIYVGVILFVSHLFSRSNLSWGTLLLPLIVSIYFVTTECSYLIVCGGALVASMALLYKTTFPIKPRMFACGLMAWLNILLGVFVLVASTRAAWHNSVELIFAAYLFLTMLACFVLYRISKWLLITQIFWLSPLWVAFLVELIALPQTQIEWLGRGGLMVGIFSLLYAFMKLDLSNVLLELINNKKTRTRVICGYHAIHFWGVALCCVLFIHRALSLNVEETLLILPWLVAGLTLLCYLPSLQTRWPLNRYLSLYQQIIVLPFIAVIASFVLYILPVFEVKIASVIWLPIVNPVELTSIASILFVGLCLRHENAKIVLRKYINVQFSHTTPVAIWVAFSGVIFTHSVLARGVSHYTLANYDPVSLWQSGVFQAGLAILWSVLAMMATALGSRLNSIRIWWIGAVLFAVTVLKLLIFDLSNTDTIVMVFAVIFVGVVMVLVGYFSPMPKSRKSLER